MKPNIIHNIVICLAALLPVMVACNSQEESLPEEISEATLYLNIEPIGLTRAATATLPDNEKMYSVRVIILHPDGTVEHNKFYALDGAEEQNLILLKVTPNEKKKIYLFANEESESAVEGVVGVNSTLSAFFDNYGEGASGFEETVNGLYFTPDYSDGNPIPMSSMYEIDIPEKGVVEKTFYVVRVATKFTMNFMNWRGENVTVRNFTIASHADKNFLMAHVNDSEQNRQLFNGKSWIDWLREVSETSSENDDYATTEAAGWLKDYRLPAQANKQVVYTFPFPVTVAAAEFDENNLDDIKPGTASEAFYLPESKNPKADAADGEQEYTLTLNIVGNSDPFVRKLPNLKALFRNTNVVVNITMYKNLEMVVDVIPFTSVNVTPDYGLGKEDFTGYVVGKDENGNKCWYDGNYYDPVTAVPLYLGPKDNPGKFVTINNKEYLLVYADYERTAAKLDHFFEKETRKKYLLTPESITGYKYGNDMYLNKLQQRVWLDSGGDPNGNADAQAIYTALQNVGLNLKCCHILYEWDRLDWNKARWWGEKGIYPKYWFDVLGNRYPWSEGDTDAKRKNKLGEWVQYLE